jgi:hypothetical protein
MVKALLLAALPFVAAWPQVMEMNERMQKRDTEPGPRSPTFLSKRPNTSVPPSGFNAQEQYVDVTPGSGHEFVAPSSTDIRGQCPGLNAAANHGFIPHNGLLTTTQSMFEFPSHRSLSCNESNPNVQPSRVSPTLTTCPLILLSSWPLFRSDCEYWMSLFGTFSKLTGGLALVTQSQIHGPLVEHSLLRFPC